MMRIKTYMSGLDAERVNGRTLEDIIKQAEETGKYTIIKEFSFFRNLTISGRYGPGIPADLIVFEADYFDNDKEGRTAVYIIFAVTEYFAEFIYEDVSVVLTSYDIEDLVKAIVRILSREYKWDETLMLENSIRLASKLARMDVGTIGQMKVGSTEIWLTVREPSHEQLFEQVKYSFPAGKQMELVEG